MITTEAVFFISVESIACSSGHGFNMLPRFKRVKLGQFKESSVAMRGSFCPKPLSNYSHQSCILGTEVPGVPIIYY